PRDAPSARTASGRRAARGRRRLAARGRRRAARPRRRASRAHGYPRRYLRGARRSRPRARRWPPPQASHAHVRDRHRARLRRDLRGVGVEPGVAPAARAPHLHRAERRGATPHAALMRGHRRSLRSRVRGAGFASVARMLSRSARRLCLAYVLATPMMLFACEATTEPKADLADPAYDAGGAADVAHIDHAESGAPPRDSGDEIAPKDASDA